MHDLKNNVGTVLLLEPQAINDTDTLSALLDLQGFSGAMLSVLAGAFTGVDADSKLEISLLESDTTAAANFTAVAATDMIGAFTVINADTKDQTIQNVGYLGNKRYLRVKLDFTTGTGGITSALVAIMGLLGMPSVAPVTAPAAVAAT